VTYFGVNQYFDFVIGTATPMSPKYAAQRGRSIFKIISEIVGTNPYPEYIKHFFFHETQRLKRTLLKQNFLV